MAPLIEEAQGYPFFLQLHGEALWEAGADLGILDAGIVHAARAVVRVRREKFYNNRYQELLSYPEPGWWKQPEPLPGCLQVARRLA